MFSRDYNSLKGSDYGQGVISIQTKYDHGEVINRRLVAGNNKGYVYVGDKTLDFGKVTDDRAVLEIQKRELVFMARNKPRISAVSGKNAPSISVLSNFNGAYAKTTDNNTNLKELAKVEDNYEFVGIASTDANDFAKNTDANGNYGTRAINVLTTQIGGTNSIINTGPVPILAGELICWRLPDKNDFLGRDKRLGLAPEKVVPMTVPLSHIHGGIYSALQDANTWVTSAPPMDASGIDGFVKTCTSFIIGTAILTSNELNKDVLYEEYMKNNTIPTFVPVSDIPKLLRLPIADLVKSFFQMQTWIDTHTIGRATSAAKKGQKFDILLRR